MKYIKAGIVFLCLTAFLASGCTNHSIEGRASFPHNKSVAISAPADPDFSGIASLQDSIHHIDQAVLSTKELWTNIPLVSSHAAGAAANDESVSSGTSVTSDNASVVYDRVTLTEDTNFRGNVLIKGYLVVAPHATLRIEPGTIIRFAATGTRNNAALLVVQGRILAVGTADSPIVMTSNRTRPAPGDWGGISLISTEKRNQLEHCRVEFANTGIEAHFSTLSLKMVSVLRSQTGLLMRDTVLQMSGGSLSESEIGIEMHDSEFDARDITVSSCKRGVVMNRSSANVTSVKISDNEQYGLHSEEGRIKMTTAEIYGNGTGARLKGGEGQILSTDFHDNRDTALHLSGSRMKVSRSRFFNNSQDALRLEDGRALISGNVFNGNKGFNIYNAGREDVVALQNWWGSSDISAISKKIHDAVADPRFGSVQMFPWLIEKPAFLQ